MIIIEERTPDAAVCTNCLLLTTEDEMKWLTSEDTGAVDFTAIRQDRHVILRNARVTSYGKRADGLWNTRVTVDRIETVEALPEVVEPVLREEQP